MSCGCKTPTDTNNSKPAAEGCCQVTVGNTVVVDRETYEALVKMHRQDKDNFLDMEVEIRADIGDRAYTKLHDLLLEAPSGGCCSA